MPAPSAPLPAALQTPQTARRRVPLRLLWLVPAALLVGGCGVLELGAGRHPAVVLQAAEPAGDDRWEMVVELLATDIDGAVVVGVAFNGDAVHCEDGAAYPASDLQPAIELHFEQDQAGVQEGEPPVVAGSAVEVVCD